MARLPGYEEVNTEVAVTIMEEAGKFATSVLEPLNRPGDEEGCTLENGVVTTPSGVAAAYLAFAEAGWCSLSGDPAYGGQGLPRVLQILLDKIRSEEHTSELKSLMRRSYAVFCLKKKRTYVTYRFSALTATNANSS